VEQKVDSLLNFALSAQAQLDAYSGENADYDGWSRIG